MKTQPFGCTKPSSRRQQQNSRIFQYWILSIGFFLISVTTSLFAQPLRWSLSVGAGIIQQFGNFESIVNFPYRPGIYDHSNGFYWNVNAGVQYSLLSTIALHLSGGYQQYIVRWKKLQQTTVLVSGIPTAGMIEHQLQIRGHRWPVSLHLLWQPSSWLTLAAGGFIIVPQRQRYRQQEVIVQPIGATFVATGTASQVLADDERQLETLWYGIGVRVSVALGFPWSPSSNFQLAAHIHGRYGLHSIWRSIRAMERQLGVALSITSTSHERIPRIIRDTVIQRDTMIQTVATVQHPTIILDTVIHRYQRRETDTAVIETLYIHEHYRRLQPEIRPFLAASLQTSFVLPTGLETQTAALTIEEWLSYHYVPLLNYLFFPLNSAVLPARYRKLRSPEEAHRFSLRSQIFASPMTVYYHLLNIVGFRLRRNPTIHLRIVGCVAGEAEDNDQRLAQQRAQAIADYLRELWLIPDSQLTITARILPENPSPLTAPEAIEENARAELYATDPELFAPVVFTDTVRIANPPTIRFRPRIVSEAGIAHWRLWVWQGEHLLFEKRGDSSVPSVIDWNMNESMARLLTTKPVSYRFEVVDRVGQQFRTPTSELTFQQQHRQYRRYQQVGDRVIERYPLILFDFNSSALRPEHRQYLDWIKTQIPPGAQITIIGTTDTLGNEQHNQQLSLERARAVAQYLGKDLSTIRIIGQGEAPGPYQFPEQRFYQRTVHIIVEFHRQP